jgi:hypothetical protein
VRSTDIDKVDMHTSFCSGDIIRAEVVSSLLHSISEQSHAQSFITQALMFQVLRSFNELQILGSGLGFNKITISI